jgi:hypothetical protein
MLLSEERDELDGLDEYDRARASDMEECRPIYAAIVVVGEAEENGEPEHDGEEV